MHRSHPPSDELDHPVRRRSAERSGSSAGGGRDGRRPGVLRLVELLVEAAGPAGAGCRVSQTASARVARRRKGGGTVDLRPPLTRAARPWVAEHRPVDARRLGHAVAVESYRTFRNDSGIDYNQVSKHTRGVVQIHLEAWEADR